MARQAGFTLLEVAITLIIVGLLLGGILKGNELVAAARVLDLVAEQEQVRAAYLAFFDRFRALPGDYRGATTSIAGVTGCGGNGDGNGRIEGATAVPPSNESILAWEHLSKAGLLKGVYTCNATESTATTPINPFGPRLQLVWDGRYAHSAPGAGAPRHNLKTGNHIPSNLLANLDRKIDDGSPVSGSFRFSDYDGGAGVPDPQRCYDPGGRQEWNSANPEANCGGATLF